MCELVAPHPRTKNKPARLAHTEAVGASETTAFVLWICERNSSSLHHNMQGVLAEAHQHSTYHVVAVPQLDHAHAVITLHVGLLPLVRGPVDGTRAWARCAVACVEWVAVVAAGAAAEQVRRDLHHAFIGLLMVAVAIDHRLPHVPRVLRDNGPVPFRASGVRVGTRIARIT